MTTILPPRSIVSIHQWASAILFSTKLTPCMMNSLVWRKLLWSSSWGWVPGAGAVRRVDHRLRVALRPQELVAVLARVLIGDVEEAAGDVVVRFVPAHLHPGILPATEELPRRQPRRLRRAAGA